MGDRVMWEQWAKERHASPAAAPKPASKYRARAVHVDGHTFDSGREAARYAELKLMRAAGVIGEIEIHPCFPLTVMALHSDGPPWVFETIGMYHADFRYFDFVRSEWVVEDVKSKPTKTEAYQLRKRLIKAIHGIIVREIE